MAGSFFSPDGDLDGGAFVNDYATIDEFAKTGSLWLWGWDGNSELGDGGSGTGAHKSSPVQTSSAGTNWKKVTLGQWSTHGIKTDGTLWGWGYNGDGRLGDSSLANKSTPVQIGTDTNWYQVSRGNVQRAALKTNGTLWTWGYSSYGALGDGASGVGVVRSSPVQVGTDTTWKQVAGGSLSISAIKTDGTLWVWGYGGDGVLGTNDMIHRSSPVQTVAGGTNWKQVSMTGSTGGAIGSTAAIKTDGTLWTWGYNFYGQLGTNDITHRSSPVQTVAGGTNWKQVACGGNAMAAIKTDGTLWTWGHNTYGQLGDNTITHRSSPVQTVAGGTNWKQVTNGIWFTAAIKTDGTLWNWGINNSGNLGDNTTVYRSSPVQTVAGGTNWKSVEGYYSPAGIYFYDAGNLYPSNNPLAVTTNLTYTYSANTADAVLNLSTLSGYVPGSTTITVTINSGVYVYSTNVANAALNIIGGTIGDNLVIVNNGYIMGKGGTGGGYVDANANSSLTFGGTALSVPINCTMNTEYGYVLGGGGGGGAAGFVTGGGGAGGGDGGPVYDSNQNTIIYGGAGGSIGLPGSDGLQNQGGGGTNLGGGGGRVVLGTGGGQSSAIAPVTTYTDAYGRGGGSGGGGACQINDTGGSTGYAYGGAGGTAGAAGSNGVSGTNAGKIITDAGAGGGGGWGASGGQGQQRDPTQSGGPIVNIPGAAGGKGIDSNGNYINFVGISASRVYGAVS